MPRKSHTASIGLAGLNVDGKPAKLVPARHLGVAERALSLSWSRPTSLSTSAHQINRYYAASSKLPVLPKRAAHELHRRP
jgi:hypothetical protein